MPFIYVVGIILLGLVIVSSIMLDVVNQKKYPRTVTLLAWIAMLSGTSLAVVAAISYCL